ncbi:MAG: oxidoreductase [Burkholderiales bacterium]
MTARLCDYLAARGSGGFSLIITENMGVAASGRVMPRMVMADEDKHIRGLARLAGAIHATGAKGIAQISHCGRQTKSKFTGMPLFGRSAIADAELPLKIRHGREADILPCVSCNVCLGRAARPETICPVNPAVGRDRSFSQAIAAAPREVLRIAIAGSCLAALTAAWIAAARGHRVVVYETDRRVGGMQQWRGAVPQQDEYAELVSAAQRRAAQAGVQFSVRAPTAVEFDRLWSVRRYQPGDASFPNCYEVLQGKASFPANATLLVHGGDLASTEAAIKLAQSGHRVELSTPLADICLDAHPGFRVLHRRLIADFGARVFSSGAAPEAGMGRTLIAGPASPPAARTCCNRHGSIPMPPGARRMPA